LSLIRVAVHSGSTHAARSVAGRCHVVAASGPAARLVSRDHYRLRKGRISGDVMRELKRCGQPVQMIGDWDDRMGYSQAIRVDHESSCFEGEADQRGDGVVLGF
jgi:gamma-glutamyltranspeptidase